jgi:hypothetical protein
VGGCVVSEDLTARIADLATLIDDHTVEDEEAANAMRHDVEESALYSCPASRTGPLGDLEWGEEHCWCGLAKRKARALRRVKAVRELVAEVLAMRHAYAEDGWYSCSQAAEPGVKDAEPGSACYDESRAGKPCDCGRDARVARLLGIIAGEWEEA